MWDFLDADQPNPMGVPTRNQHAKETIGGRAHKKQHRAHSEKRKQLVSQSYSGLSRGSWGIFDIF